MWSRIVGFLKNTGAKLVSGMKRFPEALLLAAVAVALGIYLNHYGNNLFEETRKIITRIVMVTALGIPLSLSIRVLYERVPRIGKVFRFLILAAGAVALIFFYQFVLTDLYMITVGQYIGISLALYLLFTFLPYFYRREKYELYIIRLFIGFLITYIYSLILYLGLDAIIFTINKLFNANIDSKIYFDLFLIVAGIFALGYFLSGIPGREEELSIGNYPKVLRVLLLSIVMPLTVAYSAILYAYFIKILATWNWPSGIVSNLVLWFSIITSFVIFLVYTLKDSNKWVNIYVRWAPVLILPLMAMMFASIGIRIQAYGITENRYYVVIAGLWAIGYMVYMIIKSRKPRNIVLSISLAILAVISVYGPISSFSISMFSQNSRFEAILRNNGMLVDSTIVKPAKALSDSDKSKVSSIITYFNQYHSLKDVRYLPKDFKTEDSEKLFGFSINDFSRDNYRNNVYFSHYLSEESQFVAINGYDYYVQFPYYKLTKIKSDRANLEIVYYADNKELKISKDSKVIYTGKPDDIAIKIHNANKGKEALSSKEMSYTDENSELKIMYLFRNISGTQDSTGNTITMNTSEFSLFIKIK